MFHLRRILVVLFACLIVFSVQKGAYSQLRVVPQEEEEASEQQAATQQLAPTAEVGADADRFYDPANPDLHVLQRGPEARADLPRDKRGAVDWMGALRSGAITPRDNLAGTRRPDVLNLDVILKNTKEMPYVRFPHNSHTEWLACNNCHNSIFIPKAGANEITMEKIFRGEYCGKCHDRVAFVTHNSCERCHSVPHANSKQWW